MVFVTISREGALDIDTLLDELSAIPEVQDVYLVTGQFDLVMSLIARDMDHLKDVAYRSLTQRPEIARYETAIAYEHRRSPGIDNLSSS